MIVTETTARGMNESGENVPVEMVTVCAGHAGRSPGYGALAPLGVPALLLLLAELSHPRAGSLQGQLSFQIHKP